MRDFIKSRWPKKYLGSTFWQAQCHSRDIIFCSLNRNLCNRNSVHIYSAPGPYHCCLRLRIFWSLWNSSTPKNRRRKEGATTVLEHLVFTIKFMIATAESTRDESRSISSRCSFAAVSTQKLHNAISWHLGLRSLAREDVSRNNDTCVHHLALSSPLNT